MVKVTGGASPDFNTSSNEDDASVGKYKKVEVEKHVPSSDRKSKVESKSIHDRSVEKKPSLKSRIKGLFKSNPNAGQQPHNHPVYLLGGGALMTLGCALIGATGPIGLGIMVFGMLATIHAFTDIYDDDGGPPPTQEELDKMQNDQQQAENKNLDENKKRADEANKSNKSNKSKDNNIPGDFIAQPVDFSGGRVDFPENVNPVPPPQLNADYSGPGWNDVFDTATQMGVPPDLANSYMNDCLNRLSSVPPDQAANPENLLSLPLVQNFSENYSSQTGGQEVPLISGLNNMGGLAGDIYSSVAPTQAQGGQPATPQAAGEFVAVKVSNEQDASPRERVTLPINIGGMINNTLNRSDVEDAGGKKGDTDSGNTEAFQKEVMNRKHLQTSVHNIVKKLEESNERVD